MEKKTQKRRALSYGEELIERKQLQNVSPSACFLKNRSGDTSSKETDEQQQLLLETPLTYTEKGWKRNSQPIKHIVNSLEM